MGTGAADAGGADGVVFIDDILPLSTGVTVVAREVEDTDENRTLYGYAICARFAD